MKFLFSIFFSIILFSAASAQDYIMSGSEVIVSKPIIFETGTAVLSPESDEAIAIIKKYLDDKSYVSLMRIEGHVSGSTDPQTLSEKRALAVCKKLIAEGIDCKRLIPVGFGNTKPVEDNNTPGGKAANTRITFVNASLRGHAIGGMPVDGGGLVAGDPCQ